jgi:hypothetical protein
LFFLGFSHNVFVLYFFCWEFPTTMYLLLFLLFSWVSLTQLFLSINIWSFLSFCESLVFRQFFEHGFSLV